MMTGIVLALAGLSLWSLARTVHRHPEQIRLGDTTFVVGTDQHYGPIVDRNGPLLFQDLVGTHRDVYVQHLGPRRWATFSSVAPGSDRSCQLRWQVARKLFTDPCVAGRTFAADGTGLFHYLTTVDKKGRVVVDLNKAVPAAKTP